MRVSRVVAAVFSQQRFELRKELFDGTEVWALGWRIAQRLAGGLDHLPDASYLVTAQIVYDDDIAGRRVTQALLDKGEEALALHGAIENIRRGDLVAPQGGDECRRLPNGRAGRWTAGRAAA
jgi:hypothetical protein